MLLVSASSTPDLVALAAQCLSRIVVMLKRALLLATDATYAASAGAGAGVGASGVFAEGEAEDPNGAGSPDCGPGSQRAAAQQHVQDGASGTTAEQLLPHGLPPAPADGGGSYAGTAGRSLGAAWAADDEPLNVTRLAYLVGLQVGRAATKPQPGPVALASLCRLHGQVWSALRHRNSPPFAPPMTGLLCTEGPAAPLRRGTTGGGAASAAAAGPGGAAGGRERGRVHQVVKPAAGACWS